MIDNYQAERALEKELRQAPVYNIARIGAVYDDGVTLIFPGATSPSEKHYLTNAQATFYAGDKVYIVKISGTYIVVCSLTRH